MAARGQGIIARIISNIRSRMNEEQRTGFVIGKDYLGNHYFEQPADPSRGIRKPRRWYKTVDPEAWDKSMPPEWEAWLRYRRDDPPTEQEVIRNLSVSESRRTKADQIKERFASKKTDITEEAGEKKIPETKYEKYPEYQTDPDKVTKE